MQFTPQNYLPANPTRNNITTLHNTPNPFMPSPKKTPQNKLQKKHFSKSAKTSHVGMHFQQKTLPQKPTKQATMHTGRHAQTTHTSQRDAFTTYLPSLLATCCKCIRMLKRKCAKGIQAACKNLPRAYFSL